MFLTEAQEGEGEAEKNDCRNRAEIFLREKFSELEKFPELLFMFICLKTATNVKFHELLTKIRIGIFRGARFWAEEIDSMNFLV